jgi:GNAT superfamily N-acetyltransferase
MLRAILQRAVRVIAEDYWNGWLYECETGGAEPAAGVVRCAAVEDVAQILHSQDQELRKQAWRPEKDMWAFGAWVNGRLAAVCWFQAREAYRRHGGLFKLAPDEAELVQITTASEFRGRGVAAALIGYGAAAMAQAGFRKLYAKIWRGNTSSLRAFERAGWTRCARFFSLRVRRRKEPVLFMFRVRRPL